MRALALQVGIRGYAKKSFPLTAALLILPMLVVLLSGFDGLYGQDAYEYLRYAKGIHRWFITGAVPEDMLFPLYYSLAGGFLSLAGGTEVIWLQLISLLAYSLGGFYLYRILNLLYAEHGGSRLYVLLFYALSPYVFRFSTLVMSDTFCTFLCLGALYHFLLFRSMSRRVDFYCSFAYLTAAVLTRTPSLSLLFVPGSALVYYAASKRDWKIWPPALLMAGVLLLPDLLLRHRLLCFAINGHGAELVYLRSHPHWSVLSWFCSSFKTLDGAADYHQPNIIWAFYHFIHPGFLFPGAILIFFMRLRDFSSRNYVLIFLSVLLYSLFLAGFEIQNQRFLLLSFPCVLILLYPAFQRIWISLPSHRRKFAVIAAVCIQLCLFTYSYATVWRINQGEKEIAEYIRQRPSLPIYTLGMGPMLHARGIENECTELWDAHLTRLSTPAYALIDPDMIAKQFAKQQTELNWKFIQSNARLAEIHAFSNGYKLFRLN